MNAIRLASLLMACGLVASCSGVGVLESSDPAVKLDQANQLLYRQDRPLIAERLIREAIDIYRQEGNESGLAEAYRAYGFFFRANAIEGKWFNYYKKNGFLEPNATFESRHPKSIEYFNKAGAIFAKEGRYDRLTNIHFNSGITYVLMGEFKAACQAFDTSLDDFRENMRRNPNAKPNVPAGYDSYEAFLKATKDRYGCSQVQAGL